MHHQLLCPTPLKTFLKGSSPRPRHAISQDPGTWSLWSGSLDLRGGRGGTGARQIANVALHRVPRSCMASVSPCEELSRSKVQDARSLEGARAQKRRDTQRASSNTGDSGRPSAHTHQTSLATAYAKEIKIKLYGLGNGEVD